jgi:hypothetical protein
VTKAKGWILALFVMSALFPRTSSSRAQGSATGNAASINAQSFTQKCAALGVVSCYGFDSASNVRTHPSGDPFPLRYGGWGATGPCGSAGLGKEYTYTINRDSGNAKGSEEANAVAKVQNGTCYYPTIDTTIFASGEGALRIEVPSNSDGANGGYFDTTFQGLDRPPIRVGPDNGSEIWHQFQYRTHNVANNTFNGAFNDIAKVIIFGNQPPGLDYLGSDITLASVFGFAKQHQGLWESYTRSPDGNFAVTSRNAGGVIYLQTGSMCAYNGAGPYGGSDCVKAVDDRWQEITRRMKLRPVADNFSVSGTTLSRRGTFSTGMVGRFVYIVGDNYYPIIGYTNSGAVKLGGNPPTGTDKSVYISGYPNSILEEWVDGILVTKMSDAVFTWNLATPGWGQFRLQPHMTNKNPEVTHTPGTVWYDDFVVSTQPIPTSKASRQSRR